LSAETKSDEKDQTHFELAAHMVILGIVTNLGILTPNQSNLKRLKKGENSQRRFVSLWNANLFEKSTKPINVVRRGKKLRSRLNPQFNHEEVVRISYSTKSYILGIACRKRNLVAR